MTKYLSPSPKFQAFDSNGNPLVGGKLYTYAAGSNTPLATYTDATGNSANTNPVILDADGQANVWLSNAAYKFTLQDANSVPQWTVDNIIGVGFVQANIVYWGGTSTGSANAQAIITNPPFTVYQVPLIVSFIAGFTNTGPMTLNVNSLGAVNVLKESPTGPVALSGGEIVEGNIYQLSFDGTDFQLLNSPALFPGQEQTVASASTTSLASHSTNAIVISGTTTITSFGTSGDPTSAFYFVRFTGNLTLTYNGTSLILPGAANIQVKSGDSAIVQDLGSNNWKVVEYTPLAAGALGLSSPVQGSFGNLSIAWTSNTTVSISASQVSLQTTSGLSNLATNVSLSLSTATVGANGLDTGTLTSGAWYYLYVIYNPSTSTKASLMSLSATSPTLPSGYTYFGRVGSCKLDGSSNIVGFTQFGRDWNYQLGNNLSSLAMANGSTSSAWTAVSTTDFIPSTAKIIFVGISSSNTLAGVASNNNYTPQSGNASGTNPPVFWASSAATATISAKIPVESSNIYYWSGGSVAYLNCYGFTDNL